MIKIISQYVSYGFASVYGRGKQTSGRTQWRFYYPDFSLILTDRFETFEGQQLPVGLLATVETEQETIEKALEFTRDVAESILSLVALNTLTVIHDPKLIGYVDLTNRRARSLSYPFNNPSPVGPLTVMKEAEFRELFKKYEASQEKKRLMRALSWLRKGINENNTLDEFIAYFTGLEILACLLKDKLQMKMRSPGKWEGIVQIYDNLGEVTFCDVYQSRQWLLHGFRELDAIFVKEIQSQTEPTRHALIKSIGDILNLDGSDIQHLIAKPLRRQRTPPWVAVEADFISPPGLSEDDLIAEFPRVIANVTSTRIELGEQGELNFQHKLNLEFIGPEGVRWENITFDKWADSDNEIARSNICIDSQSE